MKHRKLLACLLSVLLLVSLLAGCAAAPAETTASTTEQTETPPETTQAVETTAAIETTAAVVPAVDYTVFCGKYSDTETVEGPCYTVNIISVDNEAKTVVLTVSFIGRNASPVYETDEITATIEDNHTAAFEWKDSWSNQGTGSLVLDPDDPQTVQIMMTVTEEAEVNRGTLSTKGEYKTLNRR